MPLALVEVETVLLGGALLVVLLFVFAMAMFEDSGGVPTGTDAYAAEAAQGPPEDAVERHEHVSTPARAAEAAGGGTPEGSAIHPGLVGVTVAVILAVAGGGAFLVGGRDEEVASGRPLWPLAAAGTDRQDDTTARRPGRRYTAPVPDEASGEDAASVSRETTPEEQVPPDVPAVDVADVRAGFLAAAVGAPAISELAPTPAPDGGLVGGGGPSSGQGPVWTGPTVYPPGVIGPGREAGPAAGQTPWDSPVPAPGRPGATAAPGGPTAPTAGPAPGQAPDPGPSSPPVPVPEPTLTPVPEPTLTPVPEPTLPPVPEPTLPPVPEPTLPPVPEPTLPPVPEPTLPPVPEPTAESPPEPTTPPTTP